MLRHIFRRKSIWILTVLILILTGIIIFNKTKQLPDGTSFEGDVHYIDEVEFLSDLTYQKPDGEMTAEQEIFKEIFNVILEAEEFVVVDMFLFNDYTDQDRNFPDLSGRLTQALIEQKKKHPNLQVVFITDPINTGYHSYTEKHIEKLKNNDIEVVMSDLSELRDSNTFYSAGWRLLFQAFGQKGKGWLPNALAEEAPKMTARSYLELFNVKANHRKAVATEKNAIISSANPHNESGFASNIAFKVSGDIIHDIVDAEQAVINYSEGKTIIDHAEKVQQTEGNIAVQYLTEGKILKHILQEIKQADAGDMIWLGMFYIADRDVIEALHDASDRGAKVQMILDPNEVAFGNQKVGLPNIPVAAEMAKNKDLSIRWFETDKDQYHTKLLYIKKENEGVLIGGSANHTTRNLDDLNLENNIKITSSIESQVMKDVDQYFERLWNNEDGLFTSSYKTNEDSLTPLLRTTYWVQKVSGLTTY